MIALIVIMKKGGRQHSSSRKEGHRLAMLRRSASWDTCTALLSLHCLSLECERQPGSSLCSTSCHFPSEHLSVSRRLQTVHTQPCEPVIRIVNEVDGVAHLPLPPTADNPSCSTFILVFCEGNADAPEKHQTAHQDSGFKSNLKTIKNQKNNVERVSQDSVMFFFLNLFFI